MGTTTKTQQTNAYDPTSMKAFQSGTPAWEGQAQQFTQNPYSGPQFQFERQMGTQNAQLQNQTNQNQLLQNAVAGGMSGGASNPALLEMMANQMRGGTQNTAQQGFYAPMQLAGQRQMQSMGMLQGYRPLQTGQTQTQSTGGLGTWLPQVAGMGFRAASAPFMSRLQGLGGVPQSLIGGGMMDPGGGFNQAMGWGGSTAPGLSDGSFNPGNVSGMQGGVPGGNGSISPWMLPFGDH